MKEDSPEKKILEAAKFVFSKKGYSGARMQEIADKAGINKSLLHYYFRSKEKLYDHIFTELTNEFFPDFNKILVSDSNLFKVIEVFFDNHISLLQKNKNIPIFIISELNNNPEKIYKKMLGDFAENSPVALLKVKIKEGIAQGLIREDVNEINLLINMLSLSIFPFLSAPMLKLVSGFSEEKFTLLLEQRKKELPKLIIKSLLPDK